MALPIVEKIGQASRDIWPHVSAALAATMRSVHELAQISDDVAPQVEQYVARASGSVRRRKICEEAVWSLARLGWLRTGLERDVILAAKVYADVANDPDASDDEYQAAADELLAVVGSLPDYLTQPANPVPQEA